MTEDARRARVVAELDKGAGALGEAVLLVEHGRHDGAITRAYYAVFHHDAALLATLGLEARTHRGQHTLFHRHFIETGELPVELWTAVTALVTERQTADYDPFATSGEATARARLDDARAFCSSVRAWLHARSWVG